MKVFERLPAAPLGQCQVPASRAVRREPSVEREVPPEETLRILHPSPVGYRVGSDGHDVRGHTLVHALEPFRYRGSRVVGKRTVASGGHVMPRAFDYVGQV